MSGAVRQQAIVSAIVDPEVCRHMAALTRKELTDVKTPHMLVIVRHRTA